MCRGGKYKNGNPKRASRWICIKCLKENRVGDGIQRRGHQREKYHVKDLACLCTGLTEQTKNIEVRWCDSFQEMMEVAKELHREYYIEEKAS